MQFCIFQILFLFASVLFSSVAATNNKLGMGLTDTMENALQTEFSNEYWKKLHLASCSPWSCLSIIPCIPCMIACGPNPICIYQCTKGASICSCLGCLPDVIVNILEKAGLCPASTAILEAKKSIGMAVDKPKGEGATGKTD
ncbi:hypothetical protein FRB94_000731 [Tulasnella sp. JGI-2019a]|nr:hypothetical protein FRB93_011947 [Tulasnella sp. JGI-2019a]KAG8988390.1 hypothetical protein FRB94_000731 [Tulasnella sp. JGI-2019a]